MALQEQVLTLKEEKFEMNQAIEMLTITNKYQPQPANQSEFTEAQHLPTSMSKVKSSVQLQSPAMSKMLQQKGSMSEKMSFYLNLSVSQESSAMHQ